MAELLVSSSLLFVEADEFESHVSIGVGRAFAGMCCPLRQVAIPASYCMVRVTAGCGRPSAVQISGRFTVPCARRSGISLRQRDVVRSGAASVPGLLLLQWRTLHTHIWSRPASGDRSGSERISRSGCWSSSVCGDSWICEFQPSEHRVDTREAVFRGFSSAAGFSLFKMRVQECSTQTTPALTSVAPIAQSFFAR